MPTGPASVPSPLSGLLVIDKPVGCSSMDVVRRVRRAAAGGIAVRGRRPRVKVGHAGTLDPLACGVVICCLGAATRAVPSLMDLPKTYVAQVDLSAFTATDDREAPLEPVDVPRPPDRAVIENMLPRFVGLIAQRPPAFSAVHVRGRRAYHLARQGQTVEIGPRTVRIDALELLDYAWPIATLRIDCGKGTYIRSLARDLGAAMGTGGHLASLCRMAVGPYRVQKAMSLDDLPAVLTAEDLLPVAL